MGGYSLLSKPWLQEAQGGLEDLPSELLRLDVWEDQELREEARALATPIEGLPIEVACTEVQW